LTANILDTRDGRILLEVKNLRVEAGTRGRVAVPVDGVSLSLRAGEALGIVGESGSGKTMLGLSLLQLLPSAVRISEGQILLEGKDLLQASPRSVRAVRGSDIGMVFQDPMSSLNPTMSIGAQLMEPMLIHKRLSRNEARARAIELLERVGITQAASRFRSFPHELSGGMRQRVVIAIALACQPKILVADEPTTALDVTVQAQILQLIDDLRRTGLAVILVSHDLGVVAGRVDRIAVMYAGRIVEEGPTETVLSTPRHQYTGGLLRALPERTPRGARLFSLPGAPPSTVRGGVGCRFAPRCSAATEHCTRNTPVLDGGAEAHSYACFHPIAPTRPGYRESEVRARAGSASLASRDTGLALEVEGVVRDYHARGASWLSRKRGKISAVAGVSFTVTRGSTFGLLGESGCGKSTLGRIIAGLDSPTAGSVKIIEGDTSRNQGGRPVQLMFQDPYSSLNPRMRVRAIVEEPLVVQRIGNRASRRARVDELLRSVGLPVSAADNYPHEFSGGQRQRIGLARALALRPTVLVADEPVSALDVSVQAQVLNMIKDVQLDQDLTVVLISHDVSVLTHSTDEVGVMYMGKMVERGETTSVCSRPLHPYTRMLMDAVPVAEPQTERARNSPLVTGELGSALDPPSGCRFRTRCPRAQEVCSRIEPPLAVPDVADHAVACHFPLAESGRTRPAVAMEPQLARE
jgi:peptide/nickel transport system ATP-binding protein